MDIKKEETRAITVKLEMTPKEELEMLRARNKYLERYSEFLINVCGCLMIVLLIFLLLVAIL